jgi:hypothetical protein
MDEKTPKLSRADGQKYVDEILEWLSDTKQVTEKRLQRRIIGLAYIYLTKEIKKEK